MIVEFMVSQTEHYASDLDYKIVESTEDYDIYQVETDDFRKVHVINCRTLIEYEADEVIKCKDGVLVVSIWNPVH